MRSQSGMSLTEVMIAAAVAMGLGLAIATMTSQMHRGVKNVERSSDWADLKATIRGNLLTEAKCKQMFNLANTASDTAPTFTVIDTDISSTRAARTNTAIRLGGKLLNVGALWSGVRVIQMDLDQIPLTAPHEAKLRVKVSTNKSAASTTAETLGIQEFSYDFNISFYAAPSAADQTLLTQCISAESDTSDIYSRINDLEARVRVLEIARVVDQVTFSNHERAIENLRTDLTTLSTNAVQGCVDYDWNANPGSTNDSHGAYFFACPAGKKPISAFVRPGGGRYDCSGPNMEIRNGIWGMSGNCDDTGNDARIKGGRVICCAGDIR